MATKDIIGLMLAFIAIPSAVLICCVSQRARDIAFFLLVSCTVLVERIDINFDTRYWYRGTTRGFEFTLLDIFAIGLLASAVLVPREGEKRWYWPASLWLMVVYFAYGCFSVAISEPKLYGLFELSKILRGIIVFLAAAMYVRSERELGILAAGLGCAICYEGVLGLKQHYLGGEYRITGSLDHPNSLSVYLCAGAPVLVAAATSNIPRYLRYFCMACIPVAMVTMLFTVSRAGIPIFALIMLGTAAFCVTWEITVQKVLACLMVGLAMLVFGFQSFDRLKARFTQSSLKEEYVGDNVESRGYFLKQAGVIIDDHFFGVGLNNWSYWVSKKYGASVGYSYEDYDDLDYAPSKEILPSFHYAAPAHNLGALTLGEMGVPGLILFTLVWLRWFQMGTVFLLRRSADAMQRFGIGCFFAVGGVFLQNLFEWVYRQTQIMFVFHVVLGALASLYYARRCAKASRVEVETEAEEWEPAHPRSA